MSCSVATMSYRPLRAPHDIRGMAVFFVLGAAHLGCSASSDPAGTSVAASGAGATAGCAAGQPLLGATYDVTKSRFAFGSTPMRIDQGSQVSWRGVDGVVAITTDGSEMASLDANAPENNLSGWSGDGETLDAHVTQYFVTMGVLTCQIASTSEDAAGGGGGATDGSSTVMTVSPTTVVLSRGVDGIPVVESRAIAQFDVNDQTTEESFYWPEIPADVVTAARAFRDQLAAPGALAAYKAKLPADAQGDGQVVIHHRVGGSALPFTAVAVYDTVQMTPENDGGDLYFDASGNVVQDTWEAF
jgi:hypothetical protein